MRVFTLILLFLGISAGLTAAPTDRKERVIVVSWGDIIGNPRFQGVAQLDTPEHVQAAAKLWKERGVDKVLFRVDDWRYLFFHDIYMPEGGHYDEYRKKVLAAWDSGVLPAAVKAVRSQGVQMFMWISIVDEGAPKGVFYNDSVPFPWRAKILNEHPEYQECDRSISESGRKYHLGVLEFAYPEVRQYVLDEIRKFSDTLPFDGVFMSYRSHSPPPDHADEFGFNQPVVEEYQRRYGKDILRQNFDLEKWRSLRGEYLTTFIREVRAHLNKTGQKLAIGVPQGEHAGPPLGNIELQWPIWVKEKLVDDLIVGHHTLQRATYTNRWQRGYGYIQDQDERIGLPPIEDAVSQNYGPLCEKYGVNLYVDLPLGNFHRTYDDPTLGKGEETPEALAAIMAKLERIPTLTGVVVDGRPYSVVAPQ